MPVAQEDPSTQLPSTNRHPVFFTTTITTTTSTTSSYIALTSAAAEAGGPSGASEAKEAAAAHEAGGGRGGPGGHSTEAAVIAAPGDVDTHKQLSHSHLGRFAPYLFDQGWREKERDSTRRKKNNLRNDRKFFVKSNWKKISNSV